MLLHKSPGSKSDALLVLARKDGHYLLTRPNMRTQRFSAEFEWLAGLRELLAAQQSVGGLSPLVQHPPKHENATVYNFSFLSRCRLCRILTTGLRPTYFLVNISMIA